MRNTARMIVGFVAAAITTVVATASAQAAPVNYRMEVSTCDLNKAGTGANVEGRIVGASGTSRWLVLDNPGNDRERGETDTYNFTLSDVGRVTAVDIFYDHSGDSPNWCLDDIVVIGPRGTTIHPYHNWLTTAVQLRIRAA